MKRSDIIGIVFALLSVAFCVFGLTQLKTNTEDVMQWLPDQSQAREDYDYFEQHFGSDDFLIATWDGCTVEDPRLSQFAQQLRKNDPDGLIQTVTNGAEVVDRLSRELRISKQSIVKRLKGVFFGAENTELTCTYLELSAAGTANRMGSMDIVWNAIETTDGLGRETVLLGGYPYIATHIDGQLKNSYGNFLIPSVVLATLVSLFCLRNIVLTMIVFVTAVGAAAVSVAFVPICGMKYGGLMSIIPALVFVLATSGSIHLIRYSLGVIGDTRKLIAIGWRPCAISTATTAVGMLSLTRSSFPAIRNFGFFCATGVMFALLFQLAVVPWLLGRFGENGLRKLAARSEITSIWQTLLETIRRQKYLVSFASIGLMVLGGIGLSRLVAEVEVEKLFRADSLIIRSLTDLEARLGPMDQTELLVVFDNADADGFPDRAKLIRQIQSSIGKLPRVGVTYSLTNFLPKEPTKKNVKSFAKRATYRNILRRERENLANGNLLKVDGNQEAWRISLRFPFTEENDFAGLAKNVISTSNQIAERMTDRNAMSLVAPSLNNDDSKSQTDDETKKTPLDKPRFIYTGKTQLFHHAQVTLLADLFQNFMLAFLIITPMLIIVLRSLSLGLIAMLPNVFPTLIVFGGMGWCGYPVDLAIAMTACVALGIAVDDTTHFLIRFRDHGGQLDNVVSPIGQTIIQCGPAMLHTTLIAGAGLIVYYFSDMLVVARFSWAICTLLLIALIADVIMLPAILFLLGKS
ncbi:MAG: RND family transporter, partial [Mariniblastus sp.]